jgi:ribonuclease Z
VKLTLLGTGTPIPDLSRRGPSQVIEAGDQLVLIDCGSGVLYRLMEAGYRREPRGPMRPPIKRIAFTHLHSDHITGLPDLLWAGWIMRWWDEPPPVAGPPGTAAFLMRLFHTFEYDINVRMKGERPRREWLVPRVEEIEEGWTDEGDGWKLTGFRVDHEPVDQAFGFRLDAQAGSIVVSGDTCYSENLIRHAQGADVLVHEVYWKQGADAVRASLTDPDLIARRENIMSYHTPSTEMGRIATQAGAKQLVLSHLLFYGGTPENLRDDITPHYRGKLTVGEDLQSFEV